MQIQAYLCPSLVLHSHAASPDSSSETPLAQDLTQVQKHSQEGTRDLSEPYLLIFLLLSLFPSRSLSSDLVPLSYS